jgi:hypothetical protein
MLRDDEREGGSVDRGRTRVDGDKNGLRMGMSDLYPLLHSPFRSTTDHISLHLSTIIYNMSLELDSHHSHVHSYTQPRPHSNILADIYNGLAITSPRPQRARTQCRISNSTKPTLAHYEHVHDTIKSSIPVPISLLPPQLPFITRPPPANAIRTVPIPLATPSTSTSTWLAPLASAQADSLTRERKGKMPALSHLLSIEQGKVLSLAADEAHVYAGCQSEDNEITVSLH